MSSDIGLEGAAAVAFQLFIDQVISKILQQTGWVRSDTQWRWVVSGGAFLLYFKSPSCAQTSHTDSPYSNTVSVLIPLTPSCPLPHFYRVGHRTLAKMLALARKFGITKLPEQDEVIMDKDFRDEWNNYLTFLFYVAIDMI